jgi:hypothetical protein
VSGHFPFSNTTAFSPSSLIQSEQMTKELLQTTRNFGTDKTGDSLVTFRREMSLGVGSTGGQTEINRNLKEFLEIRFRQNSNYIFCPVCVQYRQEAKGRQ